MIKTALIPAGGKGIRAYPLTTFIPKAMLEVAGKPLILHNIEILRDQLNIKDIYIIVGHLRSQITGFLGDGSKYGVNVSYIHCEDPSIGLARGIFLAKDYIHEPFITILADELYIDSNHAEIKNLPNRDFSAICGVNVTRNPLNIKRNYSVYLEDGRISNLEEKPEVIKNNLLGCGTYIFNSSIFEAIDKASPSPKSGQVELTDIINSLAMANFHVFPFFLKGEYFNINSIEDYNAANYEVRSRNFDKYKVSMVVPAFNEEESIGYVINDFIEHVDELFVVDNSSSDNTARIALELGARVETVNLKGYGDTIKYGLDNAIGDILIVMEADYSFRSKDLYKILEYLKDADMVLGTRTTCEMIEQGANMSGIQQWANIFVAKILELLWWGQRPRFTDVGCTYRGVWRDSYYKFRDYLTGTGPEFSPEMMIEAIRSRKRVIEVPISYFPRIGGESKHSANYWNLSKTALRMLKLIFKKKFFH
ncbi:MAG: sugar phosphate nucleotidyltransferase [Spirochaetota bacterium]|nr:sugar phosphate nucleotidyltransferase [Spirochaetota bacterium]